MKLKLAYQTLNPQKSLKNKSLPKLIAKNFGSSENIIRSIDNSKSEGNKSYRIRMMTKITKQLETVNKNYDAIRMAVPT